MRIVALEEHLMTQPVLDAWRALDPARRDPSMGHAEEGPPAAKLLEVGPERLAAMDAAGVDVQVLSLTTPGLQTLEPADARGLQTQANDAIAGHVRARPDRFRGLAALATPDPAAAAAELERAVRTLGLDGAMLHGRTGERNLDDEALWPIYEAAEALRAPLHLHPQVPAAAVRGAYYDGLPDGLDAALASFGFGWHLETGIQLLRMVVGGVFERFPDLQVVVGHWGEVVLFYLERIDGLSRLGSLPRTPSEVVRSNVLVTPSGMVSPRYLRWAVEVLGAERIMLATDYPFVGAEPGALEGLLRDSGLSAAEQEAIASGTYDALVAGIRR